MSSNDRAATPALDRSDARMSHEEGMVDALWSSWTGCAPAISACCRLSSASS